MGKLSGPQRLLIVSVVTVLIAWFVGPFVAGEMRTIHRQMQALTYAHSVNSSGREPYDLFGLRTSHSAISRTEGSSDHAAP
jgi:hypothetical protein